MLESLSCSLVLWEPILPSCGERVLMRHGCYNLGITTLQERKSPQNTRWMTYPEEKCDEFTPCYFVKGPRKNRIISIRHVRLGGLAGRRPSCFPSLGGCNAPDSHDQLISSQLSSNPDDLIQVCCSWASCKAGSTAALEDGLWAPLVSGKVKKKKIIIVEVS